MPSQLFVLCYQVGVQLGLQRQPQVLAPGKDVEIVLK